jgi:hypothetical protein
VVCGWFTEEDPDVANADAAKTAPDVRRKLDAESFIRVS